MDGRQDWQYSTARDWLCRPPDYVNRKRNCLYIGIDGFSEILKDMYLFICNPTVKEACCERRIIIARSDGKVNYDKKIQECLQDAA